MSGRPLPLHTAEEVAERLRADIARDGELLRDLEARRDRLGAVDRWTQEHAARFILDDTRLRAQQGRARTLLQWLTAELW